jgi:hypothetical protein
MALKKGRLVFVVVAALAAAIESDLHVGIGAQSATGTIEGKVRLNGPAVPSAVIRMGADPYCAELYRGKRAIQETTVLSKDGGLENVFVSLTGSFPATPVPSVPVTIDQEACLYHPRVVGARVGQTLEIRNGDMTLHNVHSLSKNGNEFNVSEPVKGMVQKFELGHEEVMLQIKCDVHRWMTEYVGVVNHPYFAVSADGGRFKISGVPVASDSGVARGVRHAGENRGRHAGCDDHGRVHIRAETVGPLRRDHNAGHHTSGDRSMKRYVSWLLVIAAVGFLTTTQIHAHHPVAAMYFSDRTQEIDGKLVEFRFRNPHSFVYVEAPDDKGQIQRWAIEWLSGLQLNRQGVLVDTLKPGDRLVVTGYPARNTSEHQLRLRTIARPKDGWRWTGTFE